MFQFLTSLKWNVFIHLIIIIIQQMFIIHTRHTLTLLYRPINLEKKNYKDVIIFLIFTCLYYIFIGAYRVCIYSTWSVWTNGSALTNTALYAELILRHILTRTQHFSKVNVSIIVVKKNLS